MEVSQLPTDMRCSIAFLYGDTAIRVGTGNSSQDDYGYELGTDTIKKSFSPQYIVAVLYLRCSIWLMMPSRINCHSFVCELRIGAG